MIRISILSVLTFVLPLQLSSSHLHAQGQTPSAPSKPAVQFIGKTTVPGDAIDKSGLTGSDGGIPQNLLGSFGSGIDYTGKDNLYIAVNDRGPNDGDSQYTDRFQQIKITIDAEKNAVTAECVGTILLINEQSQLLTGSFSAFDSANSDQGLRYDPEAVRVLKNGNLVISDEYGPFIHLFSPQGKRIKSIPVPDAFKIARPSADKKEEIKKNKKGRMANKGFEGLALSPDQSKVYAVLQAPLIQDGGKSGNYVRILEADLNTGATRQFAIQRPGQDAEYNEILTIDDHRFLLIERDGEAGSDAKRKSIVSIDIANASDVTAVESLQITNLPAGFRPVTTKILIHLLDPAYGLRGDSFPEKVEGLTFGPNLPDGRRTLLITSDNDLKPTAPTHIWVFAVNP